jgi:nucleoside-diphosphate-sugar epimerase
MVTHESEPRPVRLYGVSKLFGEDLGRYYVLNRGMSVICVRIGGVNPEDRPRNVREKSILITHRDMSQFMVKCIEAPEDVRFDILYAISDNRWNYRDISHSREVIGYEPEDSADDLEFSSL